MIEESRNSGRILRALNSAFIPLFPKKNEPISFEGYKPISLCNLVYKVTLKVIASKLKFILLNAFSKEQFGFLYNRQLCEPIGTAPEGLHSTKTSKKSTMVMKLTLSKHMTM